MVKQTSYIILSCILFFAGFAHAARPISTESGISGYVAVGALGYDSTNNMLAGSTLGDLGERYVDSLNRPPPTTTTYSMMIDGEIRYTFADYKVEVFLGTLLESYLRYEILSELGARGQVGNAGIFSGGFLFTMFPAKVWEDPYETDAPRNSTNRIIQGYRLGWDKIMGTQLQVKFSRARHRIDTEESGYSLLEPGSDPQLTPAETDLLVRDGYYNKIEASYALKLSESQYLVPGIAYTNYDMEGGAMADNAYSANITYGYNQERYALIVNGLVADLKYEEVNPVFDKTREETVFAVGLTGMYHAPYGLKNWSFVGTLMFVDSEVNIEFYKAQMTVYELGMLYRF